jgi:hypothetical protein
VGAWFLAPPSFDEFDGIRPRHNRPFYRANANRDDWMVIFQPAVSGVTVSGPVNPAGPGDTPSRRRIFVCRPNSRAAEAPCAKKIVGTLARRAYRRAVSAAEVNDLLAFYDRGRAEGGFEVGIEYALQRVLTSPPFLFRIERDPPNVPVNANYRIGDVELASRLSFFLWNSMPDDELLELAIQGRLHDGTVLNQQVRRLLSDERSREMVQNFAGQWLELRKLEVVSPNEQMFPDFGDDLKRYLGEETALFVDSIRREDRSLVDLLTADYTFLNERVADHYGITGVKGSNFRRVTYPAGNLRRGLLGHGSILTTTSAPIRTRPVVRGKWILEKLLGTPPPAPPANVPPLEEKGSVLALTMRERMAAHRANAVCASCHSMIDPLGFALENFNPVGQYRTLDENFTPIDAAGVLPDGTKFDGLEQFRQLLVRQPEPFVANVTEKMLIFALGRGVEYYDQPAVRAIVRDAARDNYRFSSWIVALVNSVPFQRRSAGLPRSSAPPAVVRR